MNDEELDKEFDDQLLMYYFPEDFADCYIDDEWFY
jgi:hypothetical protein